VHSVQSPIIPVVGELIRENPGTISLGQGVVNYGPPEEAIARIDSFLAEPLNHRYQMVQGIPELLDLIRGKLERENRIVLGDKRRIVVTAGGNMAFLNAALAIADPGDEIIQLTPYYFNHEMAITLASCTPVAVDTDRDYQPDIDAIEAAITDRTRAVVTISPNNPSGAVYAESTLKRISELCARHGVYHIHDEAYEYFTYDEAQHYSPAADPSSSEYTISLFSMSKAFGFASWRIGWMVIPDMLFEGIRKIQDTNLICPPVISQYAAVGALETGYSYCADRIGALAEVRKMVLEKLSAIADIVTVPPAQGAFYLLLTIDTDIPEMELVERLIREHGVAVIPGSTFGLASGCHLRVAYGALEGDTVADGIDRLVNGLRSLVSSSA